MRKFVLLLAILVLPGLAMAQPVIVPTAVTVDLLGGDHGTGVPLVQLPEASPAGVIDLWMVINSDGDLDGLQWLLDDPNGVFTDVGDATPSADQYPAVPGMFFTAGFGSAFHLNDATYWATGEYSASADPFSGPAKDVIFKNTGFVSQANLVNATVIGYELSYPANLALGQYPISLAGSSIWTSQDAGGASLNGPLGGNSFILEVVPEPTTALLLLGALPFLRRRR